MTDKPFRHAPDAPWIFRTYAGHSSPQKSNLLFRRNLEKGQTGLSIAFDLPTQTALDPDHALAAGEVGKVGVPVAHLGDMRDLFEGLDPGVMNTSMTINAPAAWLLALYVALADERGIARAALQGTVQNDIIKEYLARGTYVFPPGPSLALTADVIAWCGRETPRWNPVNICSYHLQEAGARPGQELAFALAAAILVLDTLRARHPVGPEEFSRLFGRISFFVNSGLHFVTETCKMRAFVALWRELGAQTYGVDDEKHLLFRYGVQVNSLGLTESQPENNVFRILLAALGVTLSKQARCRALQLPAWNEALGLPRPFDQQWSLRMQQILAFETDLLEYEDLFEGSSVIAARTAGLMAEARTVLADILGAGSPEAAIAQMKTGLVAAHEARLRGIESGAQTVVGVNAFTESEASPLAGDQSLIERVDPKIEAEMVEKVKAWRAGRDKGAVAAALAGLDAAAREDRNVMEASIACAKAGVTTGEWGDCLRAVFGAWRGPTGLTLALAPEGAEEAAITAEFAELSGLLGRRFTILIGKPGLDGHSNGAEQIAQRAGALGAAVVYDGIRATPAEIAARVGETQPHVIGLSILSGSHLDLTAEVMRALRANGLAQIPVVIGGIIPPEDEPILRQYGIAAIYTPKDYRLAAILRDMGRLARMAHENRVDA